MYYIAPKGLGIIVNYNSKKRTGYVLLKPFQEKLEHFIKCYNRNDKKFKYTFVKFEWAKLDEEIQSEIVFYTKRNTKDSGNLHRKIKHYLQGMILNEISITDHRNKLETYSFFLTNQKVHLSSLRKRSPFGFEYTDSNSHLFPEKISEMLSSYHYFMQSRKMAKSIILSKERVRRIFTGLVLCYCHKRKKGVLLFHGSRDGFQKPLSNYNSAKGRSNYLEFNWSNFNESIQDDIFSFVKSSGTSTECIDISKALEGRIVTGCVVVKPHERIYISNIIFSEHRVGFTNFGKKSLSEEDYCSSLKNLHNNVKFSKVRIP